MKGFVKILRNEINEIWNIDSGNFSIFKRNDKELLNFWISAETISEGSQENRSGSGITIEILAEISKDINKNGFKLTVPYIPVPSLGEIDEYKNFHNIWGEDKDLYYNQHIEIINCILDATKEVKNYKVTLNGEIDDSFHGRTKKTQIELYCECELSYNHSGYWTI